MKDKLVADNKHIFDLNLLFKHSTEVYIIVPEISLISFDFFKLILEICVFYDKVTLICTRFEMSFLKLLFKNSKTLERFKNKVEVDFFHPLSYKQVFEKECIVFDFNVVHGRNNKVESYYVNQKNLPHNQKNKKAIYCALNKYSDISFFDKNEHLDNDKNKIHSMNEFLDYVKRMILFIHPYINLNKEIFQENKEINEKAILSNDNYKVSNIEIDANLIIESSKIFNHLKNFYKDDELKKIPFNVIYVENLINEIKIHNFFKKNTVKEPLIIVSKHFAKSKFLKSSINNSKSNPGKIICYDDFDFLDSVCLELLAKTISYSKDIYCRTVISNIRLNLSLFNTYKEFSGLLYDISEPVNPS